MTEIPGTTKVAADVWLQNKIGRVYQRPASSRVNVARQPLQKPSEKHYGWRCEASPAGPWDRPWHQADSSQLIDEARYQLMRMR